MSVQAAAQESTQAAPEQVTPPTSEQKPVETKPVETKTPEAAPVEPVKPDESKPAEAQKPAEEKPAVPEKYELKLPDGSQLDQRHVEAISLYAKENKLSNDMAQALLDREVKAISQAQERNTKVWLEELRNDKDVGGTALEENGEVAFKAAEKWFGKEFVGLVKSLNLNNQPLLFKGLVRLGRASANDTFVHSGGDTGGQKSDVELFYPTSKQE